MGMGNDLRFGPGKKKEIEKKGHNLNILKCTREQKLGARSVRKILKREVRLE